MERCPGKTDARVESYHTVKKIFAEKEGYPVIAGNVSDTPNCRLMLARYPKVSEWCLKVVWIVSRKSPDGCLDGVWTVSR